MHLQNRNISNKALPHVISEWLASMDRTNRIDGKGESKHRKDENTWKEATETSNQKVIV